MPDSLRLPRSIRSSDVFLGIDLSSTSWHVTARCEKETILSASFPPSRTALEPLLRRLKGHRVHSVYEAACFGYGLHDWLSAGGVDSSVVSPAHVPVQIGSRVKTDRRDSLKLATTLEAGLLRPIFIPDAHQRACRELVRQREKLRRHRQKAMTRLKGFFLTYDISTPPRPHWKGRFHSWLKALKLEDSVLDQVLEDARGLYFDLDRRAKAMDQMLHEMACSTEFAPWITLLTSVPGIGELTALTLAVEIADWNRFESGEALSSYLGLTPSEYSSGDSVRHGHITRSGRGPLRALLTEASWLLIRKDPAMRAYYEGIRNRRGGKRAIVAVARKLCHVLLAMAKRGETYRLGKSSS
ncbi:MAG: IS110 family transposase [Thermoanaerobaculia bacterium]